ncbi:flagellar motor control protein ZomB [Rhodococcus sp. TAF43]|uniref:flagellar motor control protein ZomB n=1 Tax=unclassified Rhodococcus (in: high G+C Gram-positive bacteria) TaxID=192944 RepID=UPI0026711CA8|nr:flagellar motor control protein ZomB [Rhodococcus sp. W8901]
MSLSTSSEPTRTTDEPVVDRSPQGNRISRAVFVGGVVVTAFLFAWGAWQRRWIADDGLIVLRTVRNLLAGNGPVFNAGERVEANTSTLWTYVVYAFGWITQARLEYVVLTIALVMSVGAMVLAMFTARRLYAPTMSASGSTMVLLPAGVLVYIALPPARDFATSGLETCLVIFWIALLALLLVRWAQAADPSRASVLTLAFVAGLSPLVRPEMAILGALALLMVLLSTGMDWRSRTAVVVVAGLVPVAYQIFRMGYYGLPYPNTAVTKEAGGSEWSQGFTYLGNLVGPYLLWLPLLLLGVGAGLVWCLTRSTRTAEIAVSAPSRVLRFRGWLRSTRGVVAFILVGGALLAAYAIRVGGDFMHGRTLLPALFCLLLPVAVVPIRVPRAGDRQDRRAMILGAGSLAVWVGIVGWAAWAASLVGMPNGTVVGRSGIVDERAFYSLNTGHKHPIRAEDYLDFPRVRAIVETIADTPDGGLLMSSGAQDFMWVVPPPVPIPPGGAGHTVFFPMLGMAAMNVPLDVRVVDNIGLANPIAAHTDRLADGRIGHDKDLLPDWLVADTGMVPVHPWLPPFIDERWVADARTALTCPQTQDLLTSYRSDLTWARFKQNFRRSFEFADYRIDRIPAYEIQRCGLGTPTS